MDINLKDLFEVQRKLDAEIEKKHPVALGEDRFEKRKLALLVEIGELANEVRTWKFWSKDKRKRTDETIWCNCDEGIIHWGEGSTSLCEKCDGDGIRGHENFVLNEFVDCVHFLLSIGNTYAEHEPDFYKEYKWEFESDGDSDDEYLAGQFNAIYRYASKLGGGRNEEFEAAIDIANYEMVFDLFSGLSQQLGFTEKIIVNAYMSKNKTNWERQANGY